MDASRISLIGPIEPGLQPGFDAIMLIAQMVPRDVIDTNSSVSDEEYSDSALGSRVYGPPFQPQKPETPPTDKSSVATHSYGPEPPIYRFSDREAHETDGENGHDSSPVPSSFLRWPPRSLATRNGTQAALATKTWSPSQRVILLNVNGERVDADLGPIDPEAQRKLFQKNNRKKLCNNYEILGKCSQKNCTYAHDADLDEEEMKALVYRARMMPCERGSACRSSSCWYGHTCVKDCTGGPKCFKKLHEVDRTAVKISNSSL